MLKVLIADDEEKICQLIIKLINWEEMGLKIAATASNGIEALEQAKICKPEILITDIRMPGIDGMELIRKVKEKLPDTEIIIISGYRHFEDAQTAIRYGVRNYLLKPIKKEELRDTLQKIADIYREKNEQLNFEERVRLALKNDAGKLRTSFISRMIYGDRERENIISLKELNNQYHFHFREGVFQVAAIKFDHVNHNDSCISFLADKAAGLALQYLEPVCFDHEVYAEFSTFYLLLNFGEEESKNVRKNVRQMLDELKAHYQRGGLGDVKVKKFLIAVLNETLEPIRERRKQYEGRIEEVYEILRKGSEHARATAAQTLGEVRHAMRIDYFDDKELIAEQARQYQQQR